MKTIHLYFLLCFGSLLVAAPCSAAGSHAADPKGSYSCEDDSGDTIRTIKIKVKKSKNGFTVTGRYDFLTDSGVPVKGTYLPKSKKLKARVVLKNMDIPDTDPLFGDVDAKSVPLDGAYSSGS